MGRLFAFLTGAAAGAAAAHYLDPVTGSDRRSRLAKRAQRSTRQDDVTLAHRVETEIFRDPDAPKGAVSVDVQAGVAYLRGIVEDEAWIRRLGEGAGRVAGITGVRNLLHRPGTPAPAAGPRGTVEEG